MNISAHEERMYWQNWTLRKFLLQEVSEKELEEWVLRNARNDKYKYITARIKMRTGILFTFYRKHFLNYNI